MTTKNKIKQGEVIRTFTSGDSEVIFRTLKESDLRDAMEYINKLVDEKVFIGMQKRVDLKKEKEWISGSLKDMEKCDAVTVVVEIDGMFAGSAHVKKKSLDANKHVCTFGIGLYGEFRGKGIGTELMKTLLQQGREVLGCSVAELSVYEPNSAAKRSYEKALFVETGRIPKGCKYYGKHYDEIIMVRDI